MRRLVRAAMTLASVAVAPAALAAQAKPVVAVLYFDNNSIGRDRTDYDGVGKGMAELMVNDLAQNPNVQVVERERIQALLVEQNLTREKTIDPQTAIRLGRIIGAQYMITGAFMHDGRGRYVLTGRTINVETSVVGNPTRITTRGDDVLGMISEFTTRMTSEMKLPAMRVGQAPDSMAPAGQAAAAANVAVSKETPAQPAQPAQVASQQAAPAAGKPEAKPAAKPAQVAQAKPTRKMDMRTALLYSKALEEEDAGNKAKAVELFRQVDVRFPDYAPVRRKIATLSRG